MTPPAAVLFDLDGTLVDAYDGIRLSLNHVRGHYGLGPLSIEDVRKVVGHGLHFTLKRVVPGADVGEAARLYQAHHPTVLLDHTTLLPGVAAELPELRRRGLRLAVCSNKPVAFSRQIVDRLGVGGLFDAVLGPEDVAKPKPAPDMLVEAMRRLGATPAQALYLGDMTVDIDTARAAGVRVWCVLTGSDDRATLERAGPDALLDDLVGLADRVAAA